MNDIQLKYRPCKIVIHLLIELEIALLSQYSKRITLTKILLQSAVLVSFCFVSLFNGISTVVDYLMPEPSLQKTISSTEKPIAGVITGSKPFPMVLARK